MRVGDRVELKVTGELGKAVSFERHSHTVYWTVRLDNGEEIEATSLEIRTVGKKEEKQRELMKKIKKGGNDVQGEKGRVENAKPNEV